MAIDGVPVWCWLPALLAVIAVVRILKTDGAKPDESDE